MAAAPQPSSDDLPSAELHAAFGEIDIYLFDQLLRGRFDRRRCILDAGCGSGRNLAYFLRRGFEVFGIDRDAAAIDYTRELAAALSALPPENFVAGELDRLPWPDGSMDAVVCSAVLHFAADEAHFAGMLREMWRVLRPDGMLFAR
ncbi:MAG TPA: class I SAM-dependent methyltransferase, partial [Longimicrobiaceae bacterium]|nr:class I SAM-dependent methyltransferase [Longimicrobiaceae bacterium]